MDIADPIANGSVKLLLNRTIEVLLSENPIQQRLLRAKACIRQLERYKNQISGELDELKFIVDSLASSSEGPLSADRDLELTEKLLTLYVNACDGALIF
jgi:hypothetical protein